MKLNVTYVQSASRTIEVDADGVDSAIDSGHENLPGALCWQCDREFSMSGDWEPELVTDESGRVVWERKR